MKITGAMRTNVIKPNLYAHPCRPHDHRVDQPTDIMVYVKAEPGDGSTSGARRLYHRPGKGFYVKMANAKWEIDIRQVFVLLHNGAASVPHMARSLHM